MSLFTLNAVIPKTFAPCVLAIGFLYWLVFLLALEPDNIARALHFGSGLRWSDEIRRIVGASLLGCAATPLLLIQVRKFPVAGQLWFRHAIVQACLSSVAAAGLIITSCLLAQVVLPSEHRPLFRALGQELLHNGPLVAFCTAAFVAAAHAFFLPKPPSPSAGAVGAGSTPYLTVVPVRDRGVVRWIEATQIDWIETQGNYVALHVGASTHLIRESLSGLEPRLDPTRFLRVHRRSILAVDRIASTVSLGAGDAEICLKSGARIRLSRTYRSRLDSLLVKRPSDHDV